MLDNEGVMIALLPTNTEWCKIDVPHMTLVYAGKKSEHPITSFNELAKDAASLAMMCSPIHLKVIGTDVFGSDDEEKVNVLRFQPTPELMAMRHAVEDWNASEHPFRPHATIGPVSSFLPDIPLALYFDKIAVGWGDEYLTFWLKR